MFDGIFGGDKEEENQDQPMTDAPADGGMGGDMPATGATDDDMGGDTTGDATADTNEEEMPQGV